MKIIVNPLQEALPELLQRPVMDHAALQTVVQGVLDAVRIGGDKAVASYTKQFDGVTIDNLQVSATEINEATLSLAPALKVAIQLAAKNIRCFPIMPVKLSPSTSSYLTLIPSNALS